MRLGDGLRTDSPDVSTYRLMMDAALAEFGNLRFDLPEDFLTYEHYVRVVSEKLDWNSSPGYPYMRTSPNNGALFEVKNGIPSESALGKVWELVSAKLRGLGPDPIRLFIKKEPHKISKRDKKSWRLISSISVVDQIVDHLVLDSMNDKAVLDYMNNACKVGWTPYNGGWRIIPPGVGYSADKTGWDWSVRTWILEMLFDLRVRLCNEGPHKSNWVALYRKRFLELYNTPEFVTSGGLHLKQLNPGVQKSGCVDTLVGNSIMQYLLHSRICFEMGLAYVPWLISMGDDTYQILNMSKVELSDYVERLGQYCHVKSFDRVTEFAGYRFKGSVIEPLYKGKHSFNLLYANESVFDQMAASYSLLYHRSLRRDWLRKCFERSGVEIPSLDILDHIFDVGRRSRL